jgi:uncharacterized protein (TIGR04255 family)
MQLALVPLLRVGWSAEFAILMPQPEEFCPEFTNPPTVETVLGVQFEPLRGFRSNHYGWFWRDHLKDKGFGSVSDETPLPTYVEEFGVPKLRLTKAADGGEVVGVRMKTRTADRGRTVQLQPDKLYLSWNRLGPEAPRYENVRGEFEALFADLTVFAGGAGLGPVRPNLWEVHYVNQIPPGELWTDPRDWHRVLPRLFPTTDPSVPGARFATYSGEWHFEIEPQRGRVHVRVAKMVMNQSPAPTLYFSLLARGEVGGAGSLDVLAGLEAGHTACVRLFFDLTSPEAHAEWGLKS